MNKRTMLCGVAKAVYAISVNVIRTLGCIGWIWSFFARHTTFDKTIFSGEFRHQKKCPWKTLFMFENSETKSKKETNEEWGEIYSGTHTMKKKNYMNARAQKHIRKI